MNAIAEIESKLAELDDQAEHIKEAMEAVKSLSRDYLVKPATMSEVMDIQMANFQCMEIIITLTKTVYKLKRDIVRLDADLKDMSKRVPPL
jgi:hypothetical protein